MPNDLTGEAAIKTDSIHKIAIFRALYLGDMLCIVPALRAVRTAYPQAKIVLIGLPWQRSFVKRFSKYIDQFIDFPGWPGLPEQEFNGDRVLNFLHDMRAERFDLLLQMQGNSMIANSMCMLWGAKRACGLRRTDGYNPDHNSFIVSEDNEHEILRYLKLLDLLEIPRQGSNLEFPFLEEEIENFATIVGKLNLPLGNYICIHPGARDRKKRWSVENFAFVADQLSQQGYAIVLTGSMEEKALLSEVASQMKSPAINIVERFGHVGIGELGAIVKYSVCLISNDTGVSRIADALNTSSVVIFSSYTDPVRWAPLDRLVHLVIPADKASDAEYVLYCILDHIEKQKKVQQRSHALLH
jgi:ADP-heptose:LPS heptosyltransferase